MKIREVITEETGKMHDEHEAVHQGVATLRDPGGYNPTYHQVRVGLGLAMADGSDEKLDIDHESWMGPKWTVHPYTETEQKMVDQVIKSIPTEYNQVHPWSKSREPDGVHKASPTRQVGAIALKKK